MSQDLSGGFTRLPVSLEQYEVGLSGAVPERDEWSEPAALHSDDDESWVELEADIPD